MGGDSSLVRRLVLLVIPAQAGIQRRGVGLSRSRVIALVAGLRDLAAYAAGVSTACRQPSHFSFAGPKEK